eukprot:GFUD01016916.1.p1 GENE.GFUD01016916.1~~GFUD01016916.1.p1  ORF type:complete len:108 (-),score=47.57 GFUD01016916.1:123-446(-)
MAEGGNRRMEIMEQMEQRMEELEELTDDNMPEYKGEDMEERNLIEEDDDYLFNLERYRRKMEKKGLTGTIWEPSLVVCWTVVFIVTMYVIFLIITGGHENEIVRDEL